MDEIKLHVGCGLVTPKGWVNIDCSLNAWLSKRPTLRKLMFLLKLLPQSVYEAPWPRDVVVHDVRKGLPYKEELVKSVYASHVLEALTKSEARAFLIEAYRVLKKGGVIRLVVPDLECLAVKYLQSKEQPKINQWASVSSPADVFMNDLWIVRETHEPKIIQLVKRILDYDTFRHKWMYDYDSLKQTLIEIGFYSVARKKAFESNIENIEALDREHRFHGAFCIEAMK